MPKQKPKNKLSDKEQWKRFEEAAKDAGVDSNEAETAFEDLTKAPKDHSQRRRLPG